MGLEFLMEFSTDEYLSCAKNFVTETIAKLIQMNYEIMDFIMERESTAYTNIKSRHREIVVF